MSSMDKMQAEAVSRAREMYSRRSQNFNAAGFPSGYNGTIKSTQSNHEPTAASEPNTAAKEKETITNDTNENQEKHNVVQESPSLEKATQSDILDSILADKEKALIIILIAIMNEENSSPSLLFALLYLVL